jgi:hypothetical protein
VPFGPTTDAEWPGCRFVTLSELDPFPNELELLPTTGFLALGYPHSKQPRYAGDGTYAALAYHFVTHYERIADDNTIGAEAMRHIAVGFDRKGFAGPYGDDMMANPTGMSGGGLWRLPDTMNAEVLEPHLVGLMIEYHRAPHNVLLATRLANLLWALASFEPGVRPAILSQFPSLQAIFG